MEQAYETGDGNLLRHFVEATAEAHTEKPESLRSYFSGISEKFAGIATSAYYLLTGDLTPVKEKKFGGLGLTISREELSLPFLKDQFYFALVDGAEVGLKSRHHKNYYFTDSN